MRRRGKRLVLAALALTLLVLAGTAVWLSWPPPVGTGAGTEGRSGGGSGGTVAIEVPPGVPVRAIGKRLAAAGLVRSALGFTCWARLLGAERALKAGRYELPRGVPPWRLVRLLRAGVIELHQVTIPEGLTLWETAGLLARQAGVDSTRFVALATDSLQAARLGAPSRNLEGYLFPETYDVPLGRSPAEVLPLLVGAALEVLDGELARHPEASLGPAEVMILASIVEAEARVAAEQPRIAAVYLNRLRRGWRLEADPTVLYALGERRRLLYRDLEIESPWNTYRVQGLPPTPICSPGRGAIRAVLEPEPGCADLFFVATGDGTHRFSRTGAEHERAKREIRRGAARR